MSIAQNAALFSLLGTNYGGNGVSTFALPNLQGAVPISQGTGPGLSTRVMGEVVGADSTTLQISNLPAHTHTVQTVAGTSNTPTTIPSVADALAPTARNQAPVYTSGSPNTPMAATAVSTAGSSSPVQTHAPSLGMNYIIALQGIFPSRN